MPLRLRDKPPPNIGVFHSPFIRPTQQNIMRHNVVISKSRDDRNPECLRRIFLIRPTAKHLGELLHHKLILRDYLILSARLLLVVIVSRRVAGPDDKIHVIGYIVLDPVHGRVDEGNGRVAARCFGAIVAGRSMFSVAGSVRLGARIRLVVRVWMEVWTTSLASCIGWWSTTCCRTYR